MGSLRAIGVAGLGLLGALMWGCSSTSTVQSSCNAGDQRSCQCDDGSTSVQVCEGDGNGYAPCSCNGGSGGATAGGTGGTDVGGSGGSLSTGGTGGSMSTGGSGGLAGGGGNSSGGSAGTAGSSACPVPCMDSCCGQGETCDTSSGLGICKCGGSQKAGEAACGAGEFCDPQEKCRCGVRANGAGHACGAEETCSDNACTCGDASNPNGDACGNFLLRCDGKANECVCASTACGPNAICCGINETCEGGLCTCGTTKAADANSIACTATGYCSGSVPKACDTG